jgi:hypothetical protein
MGTGGLGVTPPCLMRLFVCFIFTWFSLTASLPASKAVAMEPAGISSLSAASVGKATDQVSATSADSPADEDQEEISEDSGGAPLPVEELGPQDHLIAPDDTLWLPMLVSIGKHGLKLHAYASPHPEIIVPPANGR